MSSLVTVAVVGICGYGGHYVQKLLDPACKDKVNFVGAIDLFPERCDQLPNLEANHVLVYRSLDEFYAKSSAELMIIAAPHNLHCSQTCLALSNGSNVLCEKPVCVTIQELQQMIKARDKAGKFVAVGYQWSFTDAIFNLKKDILGGLFGKPRRLSTLALASRPKAYFSRNDWAGHRQAPNGDWILDSPAHNAAAHYLHNMFFVIGNAMDRCAKPVEIVAELYRAYDIENYDTAAFRCRTEDGSELFFYTSHAVTEAAWPVYRYEFEKADLNYSSQAGSGSEINAVFKDGATKTYPAPSKMDIRKLWLCVEAVHSGTPIPCGLEAASGELLCINGMQDSMPRIVPFPPSIIEIHESPAPRCSVRDLEEIFWDCFQRQILPSEHEKADWAKSGRRIDLSDYRFFPGGKS